MNEVIKLSDPVNQNKRVLREVAADSDSGANSITASELLDMLDLEAENKADIYAAFKERFGLTRAGVDDLMRRRQRADETGIQAQYVGDYVEQWLEKNQIDMYYDMSFYYKGPARIIVDNQVRLLTPEDLQHPEVARLYSLQNAKTIPLATITRQMYLFGLKHKFNYLLADINAAIKQWSDERKQQILEEQFAKLSTRIYGAAHYDALWQVFVQSAFELSPHGEGAVTEAVAIAVMKKFIWQVKRKMANREVTNHLMPVIVGNQGVGKSKLIKDLFCKPVWQFLTVTNFVQITEKKNFDIWSSFVLFFDEMEKANRADVDAIKQCITSDTIEGRVMHSNNNNKEPNKATFIGCTNNNLDQTIYDNTGNRRFFELRMRNDAAQYWDILNQIPWIELWQSVSEDDNDPAAVLHVQIRTIQQANKTLSPVEAWIEWLIAQNTSSLAGPVERTKTASEWYFEAENKQCYKDWLNTYDKDNKVYSSQSAFTKEMQRIMKANPEKSAFTAKRKKYGTDYTFRCQ